jgi:hypothetical protein
MSHIHIWNTVRTNTRPFVRPGWGQQILTRINWLVLILQRQGFGAAGSEFSLAPKAALKSAVSECAIYPTFILKQVSRPKWKWLPVRCKQCLAPPGFLPSEVFMQTVMTLKFYVPLLKQTNSVALSPHANYTDWAAATCRRNLVPTFVDRGVPRGQRSGSRTVVNLSFLDRSLYFSFK